MEILHLLRQGVIQQCKPCQGQFLSSYFLVDKPNGRKRFILNLKNLNRFIEPPHFKMEDCRTALKLITSSCYMTKIDLKEAYYLVPIKKSHYKFLRFKYNEKLYEFTSLPFGLSIAPFTFTKILKSVLKYLRENGILCVAYIDDFMLFHTNKDKAIIDTTFTCNVLKNLGFILNLEKCCLKPLQSCLFLGFIFNSKKNDH